jgi:hypothetical protein
MLAVRRQGASEESHETPDATQAKDEMLKSQVMASNGSNGNASAWHCLQDAENRRAISIRLPRQERPVHALEQCFNDPKLVDHHGMRRRAEDAAARPQNLHYLSVRSGVIGAQ